MPRLTKSYEEHLLERLQTSEEIAAYLNAALEEGDMAVLLLALRDVAEAKGIARVAADAKLNRENVYRILSENGNPRLSSLCALFRVLGIELEVKAARHEPKGKSVAATVTPTLSGSEDEIEEVQAVLGQDRGKNYGSVVYTDTESLAA
jgi:probable addiction module antidote protein